MANPGLIKTYDAGYISAPVQNALATATTGGTLAAGAYFYVVTALGVPAAWPPSSAGVIGETVASNEQTITTTGSTSENTVSWAAVPGATGYKVYRGTAAGGENVYFSVGTATSFVDTGAAGSAGTPPVASTAAFLFPAYSVVKFNTSTDFQVLPAASATDPLAGVLTEVAANSGERVDVIHTGIAYVLSGGSINAGDPLTVNANGAAITASSGNRCFGIARQSAVAGDVFEALIDFFTQH